MRLKKMVAAVSIGALLWLVGKHTAQSCGRAIDGAIDRAFTHIGAFYGFDTAIPA